MKAYQSVFLLGVVLFYNCTPKEKETKATSNRAVLLVTNDEWEIMAGPGMKDFNVDSIRTNSYISKSLIKTAVFSLKNKRVHFDSWKRVKLNSGYNFITGEKTDKLVPRVEIFYDKKNEMQAFSFYENTDKIFFIRTYSDNNCRIFFPFTKGKERFVFHNNFVVISEKDSIILEYSFERFGLSANPASLHYIARLSSDMAYEKKKAYPNKGYIFNFIREVEYLDDCSVAERKVCKMSTSSNEEFIELLKYDCSLPDMKNSVRTIYEKHLCGSLSWINKSWIRRADEGPDQFWY